MGSARPSRPPLPLLKLVIGLLAVAALYGLFRVLPIAAWIEALKSRVRGQGALGYAVFALAYVAASLIPGGPAAILTLAAGALYGLARGTALVSISSISAAALAFLLARGAFREKVGKLAAERPAFGAVQRAIGRQPMKVVVLVRLSPLFPFTIVNYLFGLTPVGFSTYFFTSWIAMLPATMAYVYFGSALGAVTQQATTFQKSIRVALAAAAVVATAVIARIAAKAIRSAGVEETPAP